MVVVVQLLLLSSRTQKHRVVYQQEPATGGHKLEQPVTPPITIFKMKKCIELTGIIHTFSPRQVRLCMNSWPSLPLKHMGRRRAPRICPELRALHPVGLRLRSVITGSVCLSFRKPAPSSNAAAGRLISHCRGSTKEKTHVPFNYVCSNPLQ